MTVFQKDIYCNDCKQFLPPNQFAKRAKSINGFQPRCLGCASRRIGEWKSKKKIIELKLSGQLSLFNEVLL